MSGAMDTIGEESNSKPGTPARAGTPSSLFRKSGSQILGAGAVGVPGAVGAAGRARRASVGAIDTRSVPTLTRRASMGAIELGSGIVGGGRRQSIGGLSGLSHFAPPSDDNKERMERASEMLREATRKEDSSLLLTAIGEAKAAHMDKTYIAEATQLLQQIEAKESLKQITKGTDLQALKRAVAIAKANGAEVHFAQTLQEGEIKLEELEAEESLRCALHMPESGSLQLALRKAHVVRNPPERLKTLMAETQQMLEKVEAHRTLVHIMRNKDPDKIKLQDAVEKAQAVGLTCPELDQAISFLDVSSVVQSSSSRPSVVAQTRTEEIQEQLIRAINLCESGGLRDAIKRAVSSDLESLPEVEHAKALLAVIEARRLLDAAVRGKTPNKAKLQEAIAAAVACGLPPEQYSSAQQLLDLIEARESLSGAITSKEPEKLFEAIKRAQWCGVERTKILKAEGILQSVLDKQAKEENGTDQPPARRSSTTGATPAPADSQVLASVGKRPALVRRQTVAIG